MNDTEILKGIKLEIECDRNEYDYYVRFINVTDDRVIIRLNSLSGCASIAFSDIWKYLDKYYYIFGSVCTIMGMIECFYGSQLKKFNLFSSGYGAFFCLIMVLC